MKFIEFPDIKQLRTVVKHVQHSYQYRGLDADGNAIFDKNATLPTLTFAGTTKIHGTNAGVSFDGKELWAQKRGGICAVDHDNAGFAFFVESHKDAFLKLFDCFKVTPGDIITIYGEWCGGNIQGGVALSQLKEKIFVIFDVKITPTTEEDSGWIPDCFWKELSDNDDRIYNIYQFGYWNIAIDFKKPELIQNDLIVMTEEVERECPVGKFFGISGIGEGIVWKYSNPEMGTVRFKVKGEKHSSSKVSKLAAVDMEQLESIDKFADYAVTNNRLNQGIEQVFTSNSLKPDIRKMGDFLQWLMRDIIKEESDVMVESGLEPKSVAKACSNKAKMWFMKEHVNV